MEVNEVCGALETFAEGLRESGVCTVVHVERDDIRCAWSLNCAFRVARPKRFTFSWDEARMGGRRALAHWKETVALDIARHVFVPDVEEERQSFGRRQLEEGWRLIDSFRGGSAPDHYQFVNLPGADLYRDSQEDVAARKRAEKLFKETCGQAAFDTLQRGEPLEVTGSKGNRYKLFKRATYCVEDMQGVKYCAVVPGVPLWDHLLGIKLMVESDEAAFLRTANKSRGMASNWTIGTATVGSGPFANLGTTTAMVGGYMGIVYGS